MLEYKLYNGGANATDYLVLVHGIGGNSSIFYKQLREYKKNYRVLAIHLPGHGQSPSIASYDKEFSFELVAEEIVKVMDFLKIQKAHFVGISLGSVMIHAVMKMAPHRVKRVVLGGAVTRVTNMSRFLLAFGHSVKRFVPFMWLYQLFAHILLPRNNHKQSRAIFVREARKMRRDDFLGWFSILHTAEGTYHNLQEKTKSIAKLYITGKEDHYFIKSLLEDVSSDKKAEIVLLEKCGHVCNVEKPQDFNELSLDFFGRAEENKELLLK